MDRFVIIQRPPSRPTYVRLELVTVSDTIPDSLRPLVNQPFQDNHDSIVRFCDLDIITKSSYRKACQVNRSKTPGNTFVCPCSFTAQPCHRCYSIPVPSGTSISHGDWNWERIMRRLSIRYRPMDHFGVPSTRLESSTKFTERTYGRWSDSTLVTFQTKTIRDPTKKWLHALMSLFAVTDPSQIPTHTTIYPTLPPDLAQLERVMELFQTPDTRFLEWVIRNEI